MTDGAVEERLCRALGEIEDPELPISILDMGLLVGLEVQQDHAIVRITFTSMGCPAMEMICDDVRARLLQEPEINRVTVEVVWEPIWTKDRLSPDGRAALREWGISV